MGTREQKSLLTIADVFKKFGNSVDGNHYQRAYKQYMTLCDHARHLAKKDIETHDYLKSYYEENDENYPGCLSDDQKQACLPLYDFLCSAGTVLDLTNIWPTYVFLVEVYKRQNKAARKTTPHINKAEEFIPDVLERMKSSTDEDTWKAAQNEYKDLLWDEERMKRNPDRAREKELWVLSGDVAAQKFLDNIEYMDKALYVLIKEAMLKNIDGSPTAWCQYGSLLHSSELVKLEEEQLARRKEREITALRGKCEELTQQNKMKSRKIEELTARLNEITQVQGQTELDSTDSNNLNTEAKISEKFAKLFDKEWSALFNGLQSEVEDEKERIVKLCDCVKMAFQFCKEESERQLDKLRVITTEILSFCSPPGEENKGCQIEEPNSDSLMLKELMSRLLEIRKQCLLLSLPKTQSMFKKSCTLMETADEAIQNGIDAYLAGCVEVCWFMCIRDPPITMFTPEIGSLIDTEMFSLYRSGGDIVDLCVWPALLRSENVEVVCKGYVLSQSSSQ